MTSTPDPIDERLLAASDLARAALLEVTSDASIGDPVGHLDEGDGVVSLRFANRLAGYPGWFWTVSVARVEGEEPTVLEVELLPGDDALLAPEWVPWAERLAEYQAAQNAAAEEAGAAGEESGLDDADDDADDELDEDEIDDVLGDDLDDDELDEDGSPILHAGDVDGVDIDELDPSAPDDDDSDEDDSDDDSEDSDDDDSDDEDDSDDDDDSDDGELRAASDDD